MKHKCTNNSSLCDYSLNDYEKHLEIKASSPHQGFNIEQVKPRLDKGLILNSLLGDITTATKQAAGKAGVLQAYLYMYSNQI